MNRREISPEEAESLRLAEQFMNPPKSEHGTRFLGTTPEEVDGGVKNIPTDTELPKPTFAVEDPRGDLEIFQKELLKQADADEPVVATKDMLDGDDDGDNGQDRMAA